MTMGISICIPTYNRAQLLKQTLQGVAQIRVPEQVQVELIVIDNNCTDDTPRVVSDFAACAPWPVRHVTEPQPGLNHGRNRALREAAQDYVVLFDDDVLPEKEWIAGFAEAVEKLDADCVVGPVIPLFERPLPPHMTPAIIRSITSEYSRKGDSLMRLESAVAHEVPGCNFGFRKQVAVEIGGFNPALDRVGEQLLAGGDTDFGRRLRDAGKVVAYHPRCELKHIITADKTTKAYLRKRWRQEGATARHFRNRDSSGIDLLPQVRAGSGIIRLWVTSLLLTTVRKPAAGFEYALRAQRALGYLTGR